METQWKLIPGFCYEASNKGGLIRHAETKKVLKLHRATGDYIQVVITGKYYLVHRLVGMAWVPNPNGYPIINHKDCRRDNNDADNLEWCDYRYNNTYADIREKIAKALGKKVAQYNLGDIIQVYDSCHDVERQTGYNHSNISKACRTHKPYAGYMWAYV